MKAAEHKPASISPVQKKSETPFFDHSSETESPFFTPKASASSDAFFSSTKSLSNGGLIQKKLTVGKPNDKYEQEADSVADKVVQRLGKTDSPSVSKAPQAIIQHKTAEPEEEKLDRKEENQEELPELQRMPVSSIGDDEGVQMKCAACGGEEHEHVQKKGTGTEGVASNDIESRLNNSKGGGSPLPDTTRSSMESAMGADFSNVKVHTDSSAVQMSQDLNAHAFTHGSDMYFNSGKYNPLGTEGSRLLAHELTHTVQQGAVKGGGVVQKQIASPPTTDTSDVGGLPRYRFVDAFSSASYNLDYRAEGGNLSKWIQLTYSDGIVIDINIDEISDAGIDTALSTQLLRDATVGRGGRVFPSQLNVTTTPNLVRAKRSAIETMEEFNYEFMLAALPAVLFIIFTAAGTTISRPTRTTPRLPRIRGTVPPVNPSLLGRLIGEEVRAMVSGKRAAIATRVTGLRLSQRGAAEATNAASQVALGRTAIVQMADGTSVVASVQAGAGQPIFVIAVNGVVQAARATISIGHDFAIVITNIVIGL